MDRTAYNKCMIPYMKGGGEDRKLRFCIGAKICSGKTTDEEEAKKICLSEPPKPTRRKKTKSSCPTDMAELASCVIQKVNLETLSEKTLIETLQLCSCGKVAEPPSYKRFMKACLKEGGNLDFKDSQPIIKKCQAEWNLTQGVA